MSFWSLSKYLDLEWMKEAYKRTRKDGAVGVDGQTAREYEERLEENLEDLLNRAKKGTYRAPPVRRVYIPKGDKGTETRPIGIPTFEDKVLQRAVLMLLEPIYEQDFLNCSYGFRPRRSAHEALQDLWEQTMKMGGGTLVEIDIRKYFDTVNKRQAQEFLSQRVSDGVIKRLIGKWLNAGILEEEHTVYPEEGVPQGGVISPLISNVYLHEVLDKWYYEQVQPRLKGRASLVRFADDAVIMFEREDDAQRVMEVLPKRFGKYGLTLHPEKTQMVPFERPRWQAGTRKPEGATGPGKFDLLGFTHYWGTSRKGKWVVKRKTMSGRFTRAIRRTAEWCRKNRHLKVREQYRTLSAKLRGHYQYYGITGNAEALNRFWHEARRVWNKWLNRRGQRKRKNGKWEWFAKLEEKYRLPRPRVVQSVYGRTLNLYGA